MADQTWTGGLFDYIENMGQELGVPEDEKTGPGTFYTEKKKKVSYDDMQLLLNLLIPMFESTGKTIWDVYGKPTEGAVGEADKISEGTNLPWVTGPRQQTPYEKLIEEQRRLLR